MANAACAALATSAGVWFGGGRIDALVTCGAEVLRTADPRASATRYGVAQVRRRLSAGSLSVLHVLFAPAPPRPLLLGLVRLENTGRELVQIDYTELWELVGTRVREETGACVCDTPDGERALAEASVAVRARAPRPLPRAGLVLTVRLALAPGMRRHLAFAYAAPEPGAPAAPLVRAWRGDVARELERSVCHWLDRLGDLADPVAAYRNAAT